MLVLRDGMDGGGGGGMSRRSRSFFERPSHAGAAQPEAREAWLEALLLPLPLLLPLVPPLSLP